MSETPRGPDRRINERRVKRSVVRLVAVLAQERNAMLTMSEDIQTAAQAQPSVARRIGIYAGELIRTAATLSMSGEEKHTEVREAIKALVFGPDADEGDMERFIDDLLPLSGVAEAASDAVLKFAPIERAVDAVLDMVIRATYGGMKASGIAL